MLASTCCREDPMRDHPGISPLKSLLELTPEEFPAYIEVLRKKVVNAGNRLHDFAEFTMDLCSYLVRWSLQKPGDPKALADEVITGEISKNIELLREAGAENEVKRIEDARRRFAKSNLIKLSQACDSGAINTRWGNDYASGLREAMRKGAVLVTTNPQLVDLARRDDPATWDSVKAALQRSRPGATGAELATAMTMQVVLKNARELRPIYELTGGRLGYVSLQVNPKNSSDSEGMIREAEGIYQDLTRELGGPPNVVFKVPATRAGLDVARELTSQGIGVNVTVNFSVAQEVAFAEVIEEGKAPVSFLTLMAGRLDDPVAIELEGLGVSDAKELSTWAGVAVGRKVYRLLYDGGRGYKRSSLLIASLRGPWHIDRLIGAGSSLLYITVFPDKAEQYDREPRSISPRLGEDVPEEIIRRLRKSDLFNKAYDEDGLEPADFDSYPPVQATLKSFAKAYDEFVLYVMS
ncbi:MAG TPA: hypothetical protein GXX51_01995 [Firmicutes bacterium]|nr:hypothetical protein [Bacillota bacterium]